MTALAQPDTRVSEGVSDKGITAPALAVSHNRPEDKTNVAPLEFKPQLMNRDVTNDTGLKKLFQFPIDPLWGNYYTVLRAAGYSFNAQFANLAKVVDRVSNHFSKEKQALPERPSLIQQKLEGNTFSLESSNTSDPTIRKMLNIEMIAFTGLAGVYTWRDLKNLFENSKLALAAEHGKTEEEVKMADMFNTDNPIISTEANRILWKGALRGVSGLSYLHSLETGLLFAVVNISAERTIFYQKTAYDMAAEIVNDVQLNHLTGDVEKENIINGLQRIVQRTTVDHNRIPLDENELHHLRSIFTDMAQDIIDKQIGIASLIGYLGGGIIIPGDPEQSRTNYNYVRDHGLAGMAADGAALRIRQEVPEGQPIWKRYAPEVKEERKDVEASAKRSELLAARYGFDARPAHLGASLTR